MKHSRRETAAKQTHKHSELHMFLCLPAGGRHSSPCGCCSEPQEDSSGLTGGGDGWDNQKQCEFHTNIHVDERLVQNTINLISQNIRLLSDFKLSPYF